MVVLGLFWTTYVNGVQSGKQQIQAKWDADAIAKDESLKRAIAELHLAQAKTNVIVETKYIDRIKTVQIKGDTIVKYIPQIITPKDDAACLLPNNYEWMLDTAADPNSNTPLPSTSGVTNGTSPTITLSEASKSVIDNYTICNQNSAQLTALQEWVTLQNQNTK